MRDRRLLLLLAGLGAIVVFALVFLVLLKPSPEEVEVLPAPTREAVTGQVEEGVEVDPIPVDPDRETTDRVMGTSQRDPFDPVVKPSEDTSQDEATGSDEKKSSSNPVGRSKQDDKPLPKGDKDATSKSTQKPSGSGTGESTKPKTDEPKNKAPIPIGAGRKADPDGDRTELTVVQVRDSLAVVRINNLRTTLYLSVPDPSGVTFISSLGGGCGWFTLQGAEDRLSICEGQTRQM
jgi:hypothetical protein